jgi:hypothetical protein
MSDRSPAPRGHCASLVAVQLAPTVGIGMPMTDFAMRGARMFHIGQLILAIEKRLLGRAAKSGGQETRRRISNLSRDALLSRGAIAGEAETGETGEQHRPGRRIAIRLQYSRTSRSMSIRRCAGSIPLLSDGRRAQICTTSMQPAGLCQTNVIVSKAARSASVLKLESMPRGRAIRPMRPSVFVCRALSYQPFSTALFGFQPHTDSTNSIP